MANSKSKNGERFPFVLAFRLDADGKEDLEHAAAARGVPAGVLARRLVKEGLGSEMRIPSIRRAVANGAQLRQILGQVGKIGSNLNQIARALNSTTALPAKLDALRGIETQLELVRNLTLRALRGDAQ